MTRTKHPLPVGTMRNQCPACSHLFGGITAFDWHRTGTIGKNRRCMSQDEMLARGLVLHPSGYWGQKPPTISARSADGVADSDFGDHTDVYTQPDSHALLESMTPLQRASRSSAQTTQRSMQRTSGP